jgi:hypothetical protein
MSNNICDVLSFSEDGSIHVVMTDIKDFIVNVEPYVDSLVYDDSSWRYCFDNGPSESFGSPKDQLVSLHRALLPAKCGSNIVFRSTSLLTLYSLLGLSLRCPYNIYLVQRMNGEWVSERFNHSIPNNPLLNAVERLKNNAS